MAHAWLPIIAEFAEWGLTLTDGRLAVVDIPGDLIQALGGLKQVRVGGTINAADFVSSVMPAGGGPLALSVSRAMMASAGVGVGDSAEFAITTVGRDSA